MIYQTYTSSSVLISTLGLTCHGLDTCMGLHVHGCEVGVGVGVGEGRQEKVKEEEEEEDGGEKKKKKASQFFY